MIEINGKIFGQSKFFGPVIMFGLMFYIIFAIAVLLSIVTGKDSPNYQKNKENALFWFYIYTICWVVSIFVSIMLENK